MAQYQFAIFEVTSIFFTIMLIMIMLNILMIIITLSWFYFKNYVCWMSLYSIDLANLETSQPNLQKVTVGGFSINRTGKSTACVPVDANANAKSRLNDIMSFAEIFTVADRQIVTASMKSNTKHSFRLCWHEHFLW